MNYLTRLMISCIVTILQINLCNFLFVMPCFSIFFLFLPAMISFVSESLLPLLLPLARTVHPTPRSRSPADTFVLGYLSFSLERFQVELYLSHTQCTLSFLFLDVENYTGTLSIQFLLCQTSSSRKMQRPPISSVTKFFTSCPEPILTGTTQLNNSLIDMCLTQ